MAERMQPTPLKDLSVEELAALLERHPWFTAARARLQGLNGQKDAALEWLAADRCTPEPEFKVDAEALLHLSSEDLIDRFLKEKELRIVAEEGEPTEEIVTEASFDDEDDLVSEDLAEVYLNQGLKEEALLIYRRLSLLNSEKSAYFAEIIQRLETNN